jgi:hypothetical protein
MVVKDGEDLCPQRPDFGACKLRKVHPPPQSEKLRAITQQPRVQLLQGFGLQQDSLLRDLDYQLPVTTSLTTGWARHLQDSKALIATRVFSQKEAPCAKYVA